MNPKQYILALDQGTSSSRAMVFNHLGKIVSSSQTEIKCNYLNHGWVELDALEIAASQFESAANALKKARIKSEQLAGIGITNQRETTVLWNRSTGQPVAPAIVWQDRRTAPFCLEIERKGHLDLIKQRTGLLIDPYFSASKIRWILDDLLNGQQMAEAGELAFGTVDSWLLWRLTHGEKHSTDYTNASRTSLFNIRRLDWDEELLKIYSIPKSILPKVFPSSHIFGEAKGDFAGVPICALVGDQQGALFGQACFKKGLVKNTYGTGCFMLLHTGEEFVESKNKLLTTLTAESKPNRPTYALEASVFMAGATLKWLRDKLNLFSSASEINNIISSTTDNGGVYLVPAFSGMGAPNWEPNARGVISGLDQNSSKAHLVRAAVEAMAFQTYDVLSAMEQDSLTKFSELRVDGGAAVNNFLLQLQADLLEVVVSRPKVIETTALGAAYLAGLTLGFWGNFQEVESLWEEDKKFYPSMERGQREVLIDGWKNAVRKTLLGA